MLDYLTQDQVKKIVEDLPSGSGFDCDWKVINNIDSCCTIETFVHVMDCQGGYDGYLHIMLNIDVMIYNESNDLYVASTLVYVNNSKVDDFAYDEEGEKHPWFDWYKDSYSDWVNQSIFGW